MTFRGSIFRNIEVTNNLFRDLRSGFDTWISFKNAFIDWKDALKEKEIIVSICGRARYWDIKVFLCDTFLV